MNRVFLVIGHKVRTDGRFNLNDLSGSTGRLDILLRVINSAFLLSNGIRKDVELFLVSKGEPDPPVTIRLKGDELRYLNPDERSTGALIRQALLFMRKMRSREGEGETNMELRSTPGIYVSSRDYSDIIRELSNRRVPVYLHENGVPLAEASIPENVFFVLGDQFDLTPEEEGMLGNPLKLSLGPKVLHTDHCVVLLNHELDMRESGK